MPLLPHNFPNFRKVAGRRPVLIALGAGMSFDSVPGAISLLSEKRDHVERLLGFRTSAGADTLYKWADEILEQLRAAGNDNPKLELAIALGIPSDPRWGGRPSTQRSTPRHRVIARFAREDF
jgi:hypothetical protein